MKDPSARVATVGSVGLVATAIAGSFVHDTRTAIICVSVALISIMAVMLAAIFAIARREDP